MKKMIIILGTVLILSISISLLATGPFDPFFSRFKNSFEKKDYLSALKSLRSSLQLFWKQSPLLVDNVRFVKGENNSYGIYTPKYGDKFTKGEPVYLYMEPVGYTIKKSPKGFYEFGFTADFYLADKDGKILGGQKDFAKLNFKTWNFNTEVALTFTYTFSGLKKGRYKIITHLKDKNSDKKVITEKWINII